MAEQDNPLWLLQWAVYALDSPRVPGMGGGSLNTVATLDAFDQW